MQRVPIRFNDETGSENFKSLYFKYTILHSSHTCLLQYTNGLSTLPMLTYTFVSQIQNTESHYDEWPLYFPVHSTSKYIQTILYNHFFLSQLKWLNAIMHGAGSFKAIQYSFSVSKYGIPKYSHPEIMIWKTFSFCSASINVFILLSMVYNGSKSLLLFCIMPTNAPHKIHIISQYIIPTCFSENTPSSVSPETHCSNVLTICICCGSIIKEKMDPKCMEWTTINYFHYIRSINYLQLYPKNVT